MHAAARIDTGVIADIGGDLEISVSPWRNANEEPIGLHFLGSFGDEAMLFRFASQLEAARPSADRWPSVNALRARRLSLVGAHRALSRAPEVLQQPDCVELRPGFGAAARGVVVVEFDEHVDELATHGWRSDD
jgi:hypothetical protein